ncbi:hypothetical protein LWH94_09650 [Marinobacter sp. G11]|uniref:hypothetical protein n=1 Tax=Marinobacter sp. G11 TaxID=2903522 RepID=UPI001E3E7536|nr:hypothetical protein [Marinobacter sp. G11]MCE0759467.1 hypothetical protein [Marinobacter sp. G11]
MTNTQTLVLNGKVTAVSPLAVGRPKDDFGEKLEPTRLPRAGAKAEKTPVYFPGSTLSGTLRRACRDLVREATVLATGDEKPFSIDVHYMLTQGVDTSSNGGTNQNPSLGFIFSERDLRSVNPMLSLFGRWKMPGHLSISDMTPNEPNEKCVFIHGQGVRTEDFSRDPSQTAFIKPDEMERLKKILVDDHAKQGEIREEKAKQQALRRQLRDAAGDGEKASIKKQLNKIEESIARLENDKEGSKTSIQHLMRGYEAIIPGTEMDHKFVLSNATDIEIGLFIDTLLRFSEKPFLGAHFRNGCGEVRAEWDVMTRTPGALRSETIGRVALSFGEFELEDYTDDKVLEKSFEVWQNAKQDIKAAGLDFTKFLYSD